MRNTRVITAVLMGILLLAGCQSTFLAPDEALVESGQSEAIGSRDGEAGIEQVILHLYTLGPSFTEMSLHHIQAEWSEGSVTYDSFAEAYVPAAAGGFLSDAWGWQAIDITDLVMAWVSGDLPNHGLLIRHAGADAPRATYASKDRADLHPYVEVHYAQDSSAEMVRLEILEDAFVWAAYPSSNFGDLGLLYSGRKPSWEFTKQTLLRFATPEGPQEPQYGAIGDRVWLDRNEDGLQYLPPPLASTHRRGGMEPGIPDILVTLRDCDGNILEETYTDAEGYYRFDMLPSGDYRIGVDPLQKYALTLADQGGDDTLDSDIDPATGQSHCVTIVGGQTDDSVDAGLYPVQEELPAGLGDRIWYDANMDGIQDPGEEGYGYVTVLLLDCDGDFLAETQSDHEGHYLFDGLVPGDYMIEVAPDHYTEITEMDQGGDDTLDSDIDPRTFRSPCISLAAGELNDTVDAGLVNIDYPTDGAIGDRVWLDDNGNGIQDAQEPGLPFVEVTLYDCNGQVLGEIVTDDSGAYLFDGLALGDYRIGVEVEEWVEFSPMNQGGDDEADSDIDPATGISDCITLQWGEWNMSIDIGFLPEPNAAPQPALTPGG
jgi:hypothetical protein